MGPVKKGLAVFGALVAGLVVYTAIEIAYFATMGGLPLLHGIPTPGGAPLGIHFLNLATKGFWSALSYGLVLRLSFGRVKWSRVATLWGLGVVIVGGLGASAYHGGLSPANAGNMALALYLLIGALVARTWATGSPPPTSQLVDRT